MVFSFEPTITQQQVDEFLGEMGQIVDKSGLATGFAYQAHVPPDRNR